MTGFVLATSAPVTNWPLRIVLVALVIAVILVVLAAMRRGWNNRRRRQADLPEPHPIPADGACANPVTGVYLGSVMAGDWLDRIVAHDLGTRSRAEVCVTAQGIAVERPGARSVFIPAGDLVAIRRERGIAGKAFEKDAVVVLTWNLGAVALDTGIRPDQSQDGDDLIDAATALVADAAPGHRSSQPEGPRSNPPTPNPDLSDREPTL